MMKKKLVVGIGEALFDVFPDGKKIGGAPANFAYNASQLGCEGVAVSAVGHDDLGDEIETIFKSKNLGYVLQRSNYPTGTVQVIVDAHGVPSYEIKEGVAWDNITFDECLKVVAADADCVCFGSLAQRNEVSRKAIEAFIGHMRLDALKIFDINLRQHFYSQELIEKSLGLCNVLKINDEELDIVSSMFAIDGDVEARCNLLINRFGLKMLILTCGAVGSYVFSSGEVSYLDTPKVDVVDTVGAGDSFTGAFCAALLSGKELKAAHRQAVRVAAFVCTQAGAMPVLPAGLVSEI